MAQRSPGPVRLRSRSSSQPGRWGSKLSFPPQRLSAQKQPEIAQLRRLISSSCEDFRALCFAPVADLRLRERLVPAFGGENESIWLACQFFADCPAIHNFSLRPEGAPAQSGRWSSAAIDAGRACSRSEFWRRSWAAPARPCSVQFVLNRSSRATHAKQIGCKLKLRVLQSKNIIASMPVEGS